jgi:hypothetical protein
MSGVERLALVWNLSGAEGLGTFLEKAVTSYIDNSESDNFVIHTVKDIDLL